MNKKIYIILIFFIFLLGSCAPKRIIEEKEKIVYVDKIKRDSIFIEKIINKTDTIENEIIIDCDSTALAQKFSDGKSTIKIVKEAGKVVIKYVKVPSESVSEKIYIEKEESKDSIVSDKESKVVEETKDVKLTFWQKVQLHFFKIGFFIILVLWILGITPLRIFKFIKNLFI